MSKFDGYGMTKKCPVCGKEFYMPAQEWGYTMQTKRTINYFCTWKCLRQWNLQKYGDKRGHVTKWRKMYEDIESRRTI